MKSSLFSFLILTAALLVLKPFTGSAETFTEGVRVSPETVKLKTGEYVWEPERAPEGPNGVWHQGRNQEREFFSLYS